MVLRTLPEMKRERETPAGTQMMIKAGNYTSLDLLAHCRNQLDFQPCPSPLATQAAFRTKPLRTGIGQKEHPPISSDLRVTASLELSYRGCVETIVTLCSPVPSIDCKLVVSAQRAGCSDAQAHNCVQIVSLEILPIAML